MNKLLKKLIIIHYSLLTINLIFALPAVTQKLTDASGEYVYYRDNSFMRESYVGFLYYDESTYQVRYYAPAAGEMPAKNLQILFSVDPSKNHLDLTGERFITPPLPEDTEIVNYIHDLLYELSARRIKLGELEFTDYAKNKTDFLEAGKRVRDTYGQFGGDVTMVYDPLVPIFNLKKIIDYKGEDAFVVVTVGQMLSSDDKSFSDFVPPSMVNDKRKVVQIKTKKENTLSSTVQLNEKQKFTQEVQADENWTQPAAGMWVFGDNATIFMSGFQFDNDFVKQGTDIVIANILRQYIKTNRLAYSDWSTLNVYVDKKQIKITVNTYDPSTKHILTSVKTFGRVAANFYSYFSFTATANGYQKNRGYYDTLIKSYSYKIQ